MMDYVQLGKGLKDQRKKMNLSLEQVAEIVDVSDRHLSRIENGTMKPSVKLLVNLCNLYNISVKDCLSSSENDNLLYRQFRSKLTPYSIQERKFFLSLINNISTIDNEGK